MGAKTILISLLAIAVSLADLAGSLDRHDFYKTEAARYLDLTHNDTEGAVCNR